MYVISVRTWKLISLNRTNETRVPNVCHISIIMLMLRGGMTVTSQAGGEQEKKRKVKVKWEQQ